MAGFVLATGSVNQVQSIATWQTATLQTLLVFDLYFHLLFSPFTGSRLLFHVYSNIMHYTSSLALQESSTTWADFSNACLTGGAPQNNIKTHNHVYLIDPDGFIVC